ncbi:MAG: DinB family protein [Candidatus Palauibacterales bacterium]|nr:DinB family protein [Candidatus Palauibacterales bacterium]MDP2585007.1 DinB family protein [Candidatus Palauibacterales bacterium]
MSVFTNPATATAEETQAYIDAVLRLLGERDPVEVLASTPSALRRVVSELPEDSLTVPEAEGKWSIRHVLRHLADSEIAWSWRLRLTLAQGRPRLTGWGQDAWAAALLYEDADAEEALDAFGVLRQENVRLLRGVPEEALDRVALHEERGEESLRLMTKLFAGHDLLHLRQIGRIRAAVGG